MEPQQIELTEDQLKEFRKLWWIFGNDGKKVTLFNHSLIQGYVEHGEDRLPYYVEAQKQKLMERGKLFLQSYGLTQECVDAVCLVLNRPTIKIITE